MDLQHTNSTGIVAPWRRICNERGLAPVRGPVILAMQRFDGRDVRLQPRTAWRVR